MCDSPTETGLYYLQSRYYDPEICRFINADGYASTGQGLLGGNMFAYCENNPANLADRNGRFPVAFKLLEEWLSKKRSYVYYDSKAYITKAIKRSSQMKANVDKAIEAYKETGVSEISISVDPQRVISAGH